MKGIAEILAQIAELSQALLAAPEEDRILVYKKLDPLFLKLEGLLNRTPHGTAAGLLDELRFHLILLARLDDPDGSTDAEHYQEALTLLDALRRPGTFTDDPTT